MRTGYSVQSVDEYRTLKKAMALYVKYEYKFDDKTITVIAAKIGRNVKDTKEIIRAGIDSAHYTDFYRKYADEDDESTADNATVDYTSNPEKLYFKQWLADGAYGKMLIELAIDEYIHIAELRLKSTDNNSVTYEYCVDHNKDWGEIHYTFGEDDYDVNRYIYADKKVGFYFVSAGEWIMQNANRKHIPKYVVISLCQHIRLLSLFVLKYTVTIFVFILFG